MENILWMQFSVRLGFVNDLELLQMKLQHPEAEDHHKLCNFAAPGLFITALCFREGGFLQTGYYGVGG